MCLFAAIGVCNGEYLMIEGEDFNDYVSGSDFQVKPYDEISDYDNGVPVPPGGAGSVAGKTSDGSGIMILGQLLAEETSK